jgi:hypothetical protein
MTTYDNSTTTRLLRDLDAAEHELSPAQHHRAADTLARVLASGRDTPTPALVPDRTKRRPPRRLLMAGGVVAAVTAAVVVVPIVTGGNEAFASWSPTPTELRGNDRAAALEACLVLESSGGGELALDAGAGGTVLVAEARGGWNYVAFAAAGASGRDLQGSCLFPDGLLADPQPGKGGFFGNLDPVEDLGDVQPGRAVVQEDIYGAGAVDDEAFVYAEGRAGDDVTGIEVTTPGGQRVDASLENGHWAAWWPAGDSSPRNPELTGAPSYEVTLVDGTVHEGIHTLR